MKTKFTIFILLFIVLLNLAHYADDHYRPLIYFSTNNKPNSDSKLKNKISAELKTNIIDELVFGENKLDKFKFIILKGNPSIEVPPFSEVLKLFRFVARNSIHKNSKQKSHQFYNQKLFYESKPIEITCGKISNYFRELLVRELKFSRKNIRTIHLFDLGFKHKGAMKKTGYIRGQHSVLEIYFRDLGSWVLFDLDKGVIGTLNGRPVSVFKLTEANADEINLTPVGPDKYGKGIKSKITVNSYYKEARNCLGFMKKKNSCKIFYGLFMYPNPDLKRIFKEIFKNTYGQEPVLYSSPAKFYSDFYIIKK